MARRGSILGAAGLTAALALGALAPPPAGAAAAADSVTTISALSEDAVAVFVAGGGPHTFAISCPDGKLAANGAASGVLCDDVRFLYLYRGTGETADPVGPVDVDLVPIVETLTSLSSITYTGSPRAQGPASVRAEGLPADSLNRVTFLGDASDETFSCAGSSVPCEMIGSGGRNVLSGSEVVDEIYSSSTLDQIDTGAGADLIDLDGGAPFRRPGLTNPTGAVDEVRTTVGIGHAAVRGRPVAGGGIELVAGTATPSRGVLGDRFGAVEIALNSSIRGDRAVVDLAPTSHPIAVRGTTGGGTIVDITVPTGSWTVTGAPITGATVTFSSGAASIFVSGVSELRVHGPASSPERGWAERVRRDLEMRFPTETQVQSLELQLLNGASRPQLTTALTRTSVYRGNQVDAAFVSILRRGTDAAGRRFWIDRQDAGMPIRRLRGHLYGSAEFWRSPAVQQDPSRYVRTLYLRILGRQPDAAGAAFWEGRLAAGVSRTLIADQMLNTAEIRQRIVRAAFDRFADRAPTASELSRWDRELASLRTDGELALVRHLAASQAYVDLS